MMKTDYAPLLKAGDSGSSDAQRMSKVFYSLLVRRCYHLVGIAPDRCRTFLEAYLDRFLLIDMKRILRSKWPGGSLESVALISVPKKYASADLQAMADAQTFQDALKSLGGTPFKETVGSAPIFQKYRLIAVVEASLDSIYYNSVVLPSIEGVPDRSTVWEMVGAEVDLMNIRIITDLRTRGVDPDAVRSLSLTPMGLRSTEISQICRSSVDQIPESIARTRYAFMVQLVKDSIDPSKDETLDHAAKVGLRSLSKGLMTRYADSLAYVLGYIREAEIEADNLVSIVTGKELGLAEPKIAAALCL